MAKEPVHISKLINDFMIDLKIKFVKNYSLSKKNSDENRK